MNYEILILKDITRAVFSHQRLPAIPLANKFGAKRLSSAIHEQSYSRALNMRTCYLGNQTVESGSQAYIPRVIKLFPKLELEVE